jgi:hypothetical protein
MIKSVVATCKLQVCIWLHFRGGTAGMRLHICYMPSFSSGGYFTLVLQHGIWKSEHFNKFNH